METADYTAEAKVDKEVEKKLNNERRGKRRLWTAEGVDKYKMRSDLKKLEDQNTKELERSRQRPRRFHAYMLVEPFLPVKAHAGGKEVYFRNDPPTKKYDKYGVEEKTREEKRDEVRDALLDKMERRKEAFAKAGGLGNWMEPVMEMNGKVYDHNPITDEYGNISSAHERGDTISTPYGTPWNSEPDHLHSGTVKRSDVPSDDHDPHRAKDVHRIKFGPDVDHRQFATEHAESTGFNYVPGAMRYVDLMRERGSFAGHPEHKTTEVGELNSSRRGLRESAREEMLKNRVN
ncbi:hypothetical protein QFC19_002833 [Naganishia cerealis]|uniref:Uncharacterized protein n=1 Tax=Naganishia cerealis TaxID=610337 RepID=A0ACC2W6T3_9TREE|nr:hypothetical protein QFC19_002833 [Naganishia cerealis]